jgi:hypothetical protein
VRNLRDAVLKHLGRLARILVPAAAVPHGQTKEQAMGGELQNTLIYVEKELILPIAVKLVGSSTANRTAESASGGFSWILAAKLGYTGETGTETRLADLFPEDIFAVSYPEITERDLAVRDFATAAAGRRITPPDVITINGTLTFPDLPQHSYDPFQPPQIEIEHVYRIYGYECFTGVLERDGFRIPIYFLTGSAEIVYYANNKPVEVVGVVKWSPSYEVAGHALNCIVLAAGLLLQR